MSNIITLVADEGTKEELKELSEKFNKSKSQFFRDMVKYFYENKDNITNGLSIIEV